MVSKDSIDKVREWLGEEGVNFFTVIKKHYGKVVLVR